jgi:hypothetical protein
MIHPQAVSCWSIFVRASASGSVISLFFILLKYSKGWKKGGKLMTLKIYWFYLAVPLVFFENACNI